MSKLAYTEYGDGSPLVLLHAFPLSGKMWEENALFLANQGFRVILPDLPGFGKTPAASNSFSLEETAKDVDALLEDLGIDEAVIGGLSMGGYVTFNLLRLFPKRFVGAVFCDTTSASEPPENIPNRNNLIDLLKAKGSQALVDVMLPNLISEHTKQTDPDLVSRLTEDFLKCDPASAIATLKGFVERKDHNYLLSEIKIPTLLIFGEFDKLTTVENAKKISEKIPDATLAVIPDAGHYSNLENPEAFNAALLDFLNTF